MSSHNFINFKFIVYADIFNAVFGLVFIISEIGLFRKIILKFFKIKAFIYLFLKVIIF